MCSACCHQGKAKKVVSAQSLWFEILKSQIETGTPYMLFKVKTKCTSLFIYSISYIDGNYADLANFLRMLATEKATNRI